MAKYLRDERLSNLRIDESAIIDLMEVVGARSQFLIKTADSDEGTEEKKPFLTIIIRFDGKGYTLFSLDEALQYFRRAGQVERLVIAVETESSLRTNSAFVERLEIRLDQLDENNSFLSVTANDSDWVDSSYSAILEVLAKCKTKNGWAHSWWSKLLIQLMGVFVGFGLSIWAATKISRL